MVFLLALLGNGLVVSVLVWGIAKIDVPRFLVANLAMADLAMGLYLATLALVDVTTLGTFKVTGVQWQNSGGCQVAGFLAVLSTELSVYTLAVITLERNYAITHAMHLNKRLSLKHAGYIMACGWIFAITMAILPLYGISDYPEASQELLWLLDLLKDLELEQKAPIYFHQDNLSCLKICSSEKVSSRTKHIATKIHHLKDLQKKTVIKMVYCPTGDMKADILTKPLPRPTFEKLRYNLVMSPHSCRGFVG
ncbi:LGR4 [Cordylochernes scorpioides]|uniref:LGR4 n=1 Tax=Cordylochernes scorpioides TaxID=51811 RepID=A0ABY6KJ70_9ARAC|nr:LGR4 [Cordylochernes scorpioides]